MKRPAKELLTNKSVEILVDEPIYEAMRKIAEAKEITIACVVDSERRLKGLLTARDILGALEVRELGAVRGRFFAGPEVLHLLTSKYAGDIMSAPLCVHADDELWEVIDTMLDHGLYDLPVVDKDMKVIGAITYLNIVTQAVARHQI